MNQPYADWIPNAAQQAELDAVVPLTEQERADVAIYGIEEVAGRRMEGTTVVTSEGITMYWSKELRGYVTIPE